MSGPDLSRIVETFIRADFGGSTRIEAWQAYLRQLQTAVGPMIDDIRRRGLVRWYSFLVHDHRSGVPTLPDDNAAYIHIRLEMIPGVDIAALLAALPAECQFSRRVAPIDLGAMDSADVSALKDGNALGAWRLLGLGSEWALQLVREHKPGLPIPPENVAQLLHYICNQLQSRMVGIPGP
jgi:hypothetical protein